MEKNEQRSALGRSDFSWNDERHALPECSITREREVMHFDIRGGCYVGIGDAGRDGCCEGTEERATCRAHGDER